jgi:AcrR family transcriptional regulator
LTSARDLPHRRFGTVRRVGTSRDTNAPAAPTRHTRPGGRSARVRESVLTSTIALLAERGIAGVTVDVVAARAGVNPTTVYRRWPTVNALVMDALSENSADVIPLPDTGTVRGDLRTVLEEVRAYITSAAGRALVNSTIGTAGDAHVAALRQDFWTARFALVGEVVRRAVARGELPGDIDERFLIETATAPLYFRIFVVAGEVDDDLIDRIVRLVIDGAGHGLV